MARICNKSAGMTCRVCHVGHRTEWTGLDESAAVLLAKGLIRRQYGSGEVIFAQGDRNNGVHCVSSGTVAVRKVDNNGNSVLLGLAYPGDTLGYRSYLAAGEYKTSAEALGPSVVCHADARTIAALFANAPALGVRFLKKSIADTEQAYDAIFRQATLSNRHRLVHLILSLARRCGRLNANGSHSIELPVSRRDVASMIGARHETVSRIMGRLEAEGIAFFSGRQVMIPRLATLAAEIQPPTAS